MVAPSRPALATARQSFNAGFTWTAQRLSTFSRPGLGVGKRESHPASSLGGPFDGLTHEPRRHGVRLVCVVFPGHSGGRRGVLNRFRRFNRDDCRANERRPNSSLYSIRPSRVDAAAAQQLSSTKPHIAPRANPRALLNCPATRGFVVGPVAGIPRWQQGVRGSNPLSSTTTSPQGRASSLIQRRFLPLLDCLIRATRVPLGARGGVSARADAASISWSRAAAMAASLPAMTCW